MWCCVVGQMVPKHQRNVLPSYSRDKQFAILGLLEPWWLRHYVPSRCWGPFTQWHSITSQRILILSNTYVKTANLIKEYLSVLFHFCHHHHHLFSFIIQNSFLMTLLPLYMFHDVHTINSYQSQGKNKISSP